MTRCCAPQTSGSLDRYGEFRLDTPAHCGGSATVSTVYPPIGGTNNPKSQIHMASERYNAPEREAHWQSVWEEKGTFNAEAKLRKAEVLRP